jgi:hypothetical protein
MLTIRVVQMKSFAAAAMQAFEDRTCKHLQRYFPHHCRLMDAPQMRRLIQCGLERSKSYDLTGECCVRTYIELTCLLGSGFDRDPLLPWAANLLNDRSEPELSRGDRLHEQAGKYLHYVARDYTGDDGGPSGARFIGHLRALHPERALHHGGREIWSTSTQATFSRSLLTRLQNLLPAKCEYVGSNCLQTFPAEAITAASRYGIVTEAGVTLFGVFRFVLGSGFDEDPWVPWAYSTLTDSAIDDPVERVNRLYTAGLAHLETWWDSAAEEVSTHAQA